MTNKKKIINLVLIDLLSLNLAWLFYYLIRIWSGWISYSVEPDFFIPMIAICILWLIVFFLFGLYRSWYAQSRFDEITAVFKSVTFGSFVLFFLIFVDDRGIGSPWHSRLLILVYWGLMLLCVGSGRLLIRSFQRKLLEAGIGLHNALIIGLSTKAIELYDLIKQYPALGYKIIGFISDDNERKPYKGIPVVGSMLDISSIIDQHEIKDVLIALDSSEHDKLLGVISSCNSHNVSLKIIPDLYDIISGQARTNQIYGFPLIEIMPELMPPWERAIKRLIDILFSFTVLFFGLPIWIVVALAIKIDSMGTVFYTQERVGKDGKHFRIIKFRSMFEGAENESGPVWANKQDPRVSRVGKILRKLRIDEIPQLINVLDGQMSLVGPRPERPFFVDQLSSEIPLYKRRLKVRPGLTGWAQVKHKYDENIEDVKKKVQYDLFYIENMSLRMDFKILLNTIAVVLLGKGH
jgi:exopolysaccharide biosynthesis polyprenyl glycosylphosphotransferase